MVSRARPDAGSTILTRWNMSTTANTFESADGSAGLVRPKLSYLVASAACGAVGAALLATAFVTGAYALISVIVNCVIIGAIAMRYGLMSTRKAHVAPGMLRVDRHQRLLFQALRGREEVLAHRSELTHGFIAPTEGAMLVRLTRNVNVPLFVRVRDASEGERLLLALGFDAEHVAAEMKVASGLLSKSVGKQLLYMLPLLVLFMGVFLPMVSRLGHGGPILLSVLPLVAYSLAVAYLPTSIRIGTDGIFTSWLGQKRFIAHSDIEIASIYDESISSTRQHGVKLVLKSGKVVRIPTGQTDIGADDARQLCHRLYQALYARTDGAAAPAAIAQGGRSLHDWIRDLRSLGAGAIGHRTQAMPLDALLRIVEDSRASARDRVVAALAAMSSGEDPDIERRVRVAAEASAAPHLRALLMRIVDDENYASIVNALEQLDEHEATYDRT